ncbi:MAG: glycosyltransferase, partial [Patescibacteria group bacterium]
MKPKLCYVLPDVGADTHFSYNVDFVGYIRDQFDVFFVLEKGKAPSVQGVRIHAQRYRFFPARYLENVVILIRARLSGYTDFYVHYSFLSALNASMITALFGGRVYYWNAGLPWNYPQNFLRRAFERVVYYAVDYVVTGTDGLARQYAARYHIARNKIKVIPNWIDTKKFASAVSRFRSEKDAIKKDMNIALDEKIVLFVHRLSHRKGAHYLPEIVQTLSDEKIVFIIIGGGSDRKQIESEFAARNVSDRV